MSYDLHVYAQESLSADALRELVSTAGLSMEDADNTTGSVTVVRGAKGKYSFTLGLPAILEQEDVPEEVTAVALAPVFVYELLVEGSSPTEIPHAVRFARRLAQATSGVVWDQQTGKTWARGKLRTPPPVQRGLIDVVEVHWYVRGEGDPRDAAQAWLDLAGRHLPEALPRRFGTYEPLPEKFSGDNSGAFIDTVADGDGTTFFKASTPCIDGSLDGDARGCQVVSHSLTLHRAALHQAGWRESLRRLFVGFAVATQAVYAGAEVVRGLEWSGRSLWIGAQAERTTYLAARGIWAGLPPYPTWWSWFGSDYVPLLVEHLPAHQVQQIGGGLFHWRGEDPPDRDELLAALSTPASAQHAANGARRWFRKRRGARLATAAARPWLPRELLPTVDDRDPLVLNPPLVPAMRRPASLT